MRSKSDGLSCRRPQSRKRNPSWRKGAQRHHLLGTKRWSHRREVVKRKPWSNRTFARIHKSKGRPLSSSKRIKRVLAFKFCVMTTWRGSHRIVCRPIPSSWKAYKRRSMSWRRRASVNSLRSQSSRAMMSKQPLTWTVRYTKFGTTHSRTSCRRQTRTTSHPNGSHLMSKRTCGVRPSSKRWVLWRIRWTNHNLRNQRFLTLVTN